jgi:signal transduction histidine kinase
MPNDFHPMATADAIAAEQIKAFFNETSAQNIAGIVILGLLVWVAKSLVPWWTWVPGLALAGAVTFWRWWGIRAYRRAPSRQTSAQWGWDQTLGAAINGSAWGFVNTAMSAHLPLPYQFFILTVAAISASAAASEGFAYFRPSRAFICTSLSPLALWYLWVGDQLHLILGLMLGIFIPVLLWQGSKRHATFIESLQLRFKNEFLVRELAQQRQIAEDAGKAKAKFLASASHDLRQPAQAIALFQELLRPEMTLTSKGEAYFAKAQQAVSAVSSLLGALLDISRLDASTVKPQRTVISLADLLLDLQREYSPLAERKGLELRVVSCRLHVEADAMLLGRILRNLLSNALQYTSTGKVLIGCRRRGRQVRVEVWDTGIGISEADQHHIFDEFVQVGNQHRDRQQGLGLGLAIVDRAARLLGTEVSVRSVLASGSCFAISLPVSDTVSTRHGQRHSADSVSPYDLDNRRIAVVENEAMIRDGLHSLLENWGCAVISGDSAASVLAQIDELGVDVDAVVSDYGLSERESGIDVVHALRARLGPELPALLLTGDTSVDAMQAAAERGLSVLHKPVRPWRLRQTLCALLPVAPQQPDSDLNRVRNPGPG